MRRIRSILVTGIVGILSTVFVHAHSLKTQMELGQLLPDSRENIVGLLLFLLIMVLPFYICWVVQKSREREAKKVMHDRMMTHLENNKQSAEERSAPKPRKVRKKKK